MKVLIVGLGLMGGAYAYKLSKKGYIVYGSDLNIDSINYAKEKKYIIDGSIDPIDYIKIVDVIILCIYPKDIIAFLNKYNKYFNENQLITDICGVKHSFVIDAKLKALPAIYISHHPMAGREKSGVMYSELVNFSGANFIITTIDNEDEKYINILKNIASDLEFKRISVIDIYKHDDMIGFTSQLAHAIAVSLVNADRNIDTKNYIGDSYRDLTRIAMINENLWCELFLENKDFLIKHIEEFEYELNELKDSIKNDDKEKMKELFKKSTKTRKEMEK